MHLILFDTEQGRNELKPFTFTRPIADIRIGILKIQEKWEHFLGDVFPLTESYLQGKFPVAFGKKNCYVNAQFLPTKKLAKSLKRLKKGEAIFQGEQLVAFCASEEIVDFKAIEAFVAKADWKATEHKQLLTKVSSRQDLYKLNRQQIVSDFELLTKGRESEEISDPHTVVYAEENVFIEKGARIRASVLNAEDAPIYIGKNAVVHEGSLIKGAFALCEGAHVNMGAKIKGDTTIGPHCKVGGEISNSILFGYSNKGHDGFLGNSVLGEWCNLGADTNTSNLKNNYGTVSAWDYATKSYQPTSEQFCGLMMGDHSKCGINTMFNTGTVVGVNANIFGGDFPPETRSFL